MTLSEKAKYRNCDELKEIFKQLKGRKFKLDCGHHTTLLHNLANDIVVYHSSSAGSVRIECTLCSH